MKERMARKLQTSTLNPPKPAPQKAPKQEAKPDWLAVDLELLGDRGFYQATLANEPQSITFQEIQLVPRLKRQLRQI